MEHMTFKFQDCLLIYIALEPEEIQDNSVVTNGEGKGCGYNREEVRADRLNFTQVEGMLLEQELRDDRGYSVRCIS